jgi:hypothetical protein
MPEGYTLIIKYHELFTLYIKRQSLKLNIIYDEYTENHNPRLAHTEMCKAEQSICTLKKDRKVKQVLSGEGNQ